MGKRDSLVRKMVQDIFTNRLPRSYSVSKNDTLDLAHKSIWKSLNRLNLTNNVRVSKEKGRNLLWLSKKKKS